MDIESLKALQQFYADELAKIATLHAPNDFQLALQDKLFAQHHRVTEMLDNLL